MSHSSGRAWGDPARPSAARARVTALADALVGDGTDVELRRRAGHLSALLGIVVLAYCLVLLPDVGDLRAVGALVGVGAVSTVVILLLPWGRMPAWSTVATPVWAVALLSIGAFAVGELYDYLPLYLAVLTYCGLTQRPGTAVKLGAFALLGVAVAAVAGEQQTHVPQIVASIGLMTLVSELVALALASHRRSRRSVVLLHDALTRLVVCDSESEAAHVVAVVATDLLGADAAVTMLATEPGSTLLVGRGGAGRGSVVWPEVRRDVSTAGFGTSRAFNDGAPLFVADARTDPVARRAYVERFDVASVVYVPLPGEGGHLGVITVWWTRPRSSLDEFGHQVVRMLGEQAGPVLEQLRRVETLGEAATTDGLTGVGNRRAFDTDLAALPVGGCLVVLDLDGFKRANDTFGHLAGDDVLRRFAELLLGSVREEDHVARIGGDEFALLLPDAADDAAVVAVLDRIQDRWAGPMGVTFSWGAARRERGEDPRGLLARADAELYGRKGGRLTGSTGVA